LHDLRSVSRPVEQECRGDERRALQWRATTAAAESARAAMPTMPAPAAAESAWAAEAAGAAAETAWAATETAWAAEATKSWAAEAAEKSTRHPVIPFRTEYQPP
jgi:hypothetical protein